ncbi:putative ABC exporter domain-containing protein [Aliiroseovarius marinus]|uniref:putative ABC exporter domain-containing protein n=1 Tax=Aliiroseovarius marinus TaxID=2500159 RepID=UPI002495282C|nr:putative ABC exporter domain-containing protein [Aliiroseovarius marinus]
MDQALFRLLVMRLRGGFRQRLIQLTSLRGLLFFLAFVGIIWLLFVTNSSSSDMGSLSDAALDRQALSAQISTFMPISMLAMSLLTVALTTGPTFHFSPAEINFLFTGPFRRRDLIIYKFGAYVAGATLSSALIAVFAQGQTGSALTAFFASLLTITFVQLNSAVIVMTSQTLEGSRLARIRYPVIALLFAAAAASIVYAWIVPDRSLFDLLSAFRHSWTGTIILIPYIVFAELFVSSSLSQLAFWGCIAFLINAALLRAAIALDARTTDRALSENARESSRWERVKQGGSYWATQRAEVRSIHRSPAWGGLGPIAWRQALNVSRNSLKVVAVFTGIAACAGPLIAAVGIPLSDPRVLTVIYTFFGFILPRTLVCDFRGDLSRMEIYKTLPIAPWRICAGQLVVQVLVTYVVVLSLIVSITVFEKGFVTSGALVLAAFALPLTVLIYTIENTIHLLFPKKLVPMGRADFEFLGRSLVEFIAKTIVILIAVAASAAVGFATFTTFRTSLVLPALASWITLALIVLLTLVMMQFAFRRFAVAETVD